MIKIDILKTVGAYRAGQTVKVETDDKGVPVDRFWRRRLKDDDGFCKISEPVSTKKSRTPNPEKAEE